MLLSGCASAAVQSQSSERMSLEMPKDPVVQGSVFFVSVTSDESLQDLEGVFNGQIVEFFPETDSRLPATDGHAGAHRYRALVGVDYGAQPGTSSFSVKAKYGEQFLEQKGSVTVKEGTFPSETLRVPPRTITPSPKDKKQIARDRVVLKRAYASKTQERLWDPPAVLPVDKGVTSVFGTSRVYNGKKQNVHLGTDLRAAAGTPLHVPLTGKVVVARRLFYTGFTVILDHGYGLFTIYGHMSKMYVKEGQIAKKGKVMGLAGATGRASGPHLHWGVHLHGAKVDPMMLVKSLN